MCNGEKGMMCLNCKGIYTTKHKLIEDVNAPWRLVRGQFD